jgi:hypothetical protein
MKNIFSLIFICSLSISAFSQKQLNNFDEIMTSLKNGKSVKTVIYYAKCKLFADGKEEPESPNAIGGMRIDTYEYFDSSLFKGKAPSCLVSSQTVLVSHPKYGYVYNYVKIKVRKDNSVEIIARYLKPRLLSRKYKIIMDETFKGKLKNLDNEGGIVFFEE